MYSVNNWEWYLISGVPGFSVNMIYRQTPILIQGPYIRLDQGFGCSLELYQYKTAPPPRK